MICRVDSSDRSPRIAVMGVDVMDIVVGADDDEGYSEVGEDEDGGVGPGMDECVCNAVM